MTVKTENHIDVNEYCELRINCGLSPKSRKAAGIGLVNSTYIVALRDPANNLIGMGRLVGDGGCFCQVVDICVFPEHQGKGLGKLILTNLVQFINQELPDTCYVSLIADGKASFLYEKFGFKETYPKSKGMYLKL